MRLRSLIRSATCSWCLLATFPSVVHGDVAGLTTATFKAGDRQQPAPLVLGSGLEGAWGQVLLSCSVAAGRVAEFFDFDPSAAFPAQEPLDQCHTGFDDKKAVAKGTMHADASEFDTLVLTFRAVSGGSGADPFGKIYGWIIPRGHDVCLDQGRPCIEMSPSVEDVMSGTVTLTFHLKNLKSRRFQVGFGAFEKQSECWICLGIWHSVVVDVTGVRPSGPLVNPVLCGNARNDLARANAELARVRDNVSRILASDAPSIRSAFRLWEARMRACAKNNRNPAECDVGDIVDACSEVSFGVRRTACDDLRRAIENESILITEVKRVLRRIPEACRRRVIQ